LTAPNHPGDRKQIIAWALYDWANSAFATVVMSGFFPLFFRDYWNAGEAGEAITFRLGVTNSLSSLVIVLSAPVLGAVADAGGSRKAFLFVFASLGVLATASLYGVPQGSWMLAAIAYFLATVGFMGGNIFYDALLVTVAPRSRYETVSALGFGLGYLGGGLLFAACIGLTLNPVMFGLQDAGQAVRVAFLLVALWWAVFAIPLFRRVKEPSATKRLPWLSLVVTGFRELGTTLRHIRALRGVGVFLIAYWLYIDGVDTVVRMAVDYGRALGFGREGLILALLITQFVGFPSAILFGLLGKRIGPKRGILIAIGVYILATVWGAFMTKPWEFYGLAVAIGLVQGGIQSLSRAYYARMIPAEKAAEFFGFYNMLGKFAAVIGPVMVGWVGVLTGNPRIGLLSLLILFVAGGALLLTLREDEVRRA